MARKCKLLQMFLCEDVDISNSVSQNSLPEVLQLLLFCGTFLTPILLLLLCFNASGTMQVVCIVLYATHICKFQSNVMQQDLSISPMVVEAVPKGDVDRVATRS